MSLSKSCFAVIFTLMFSEQCRGVTSIGQQSELRTGRASRRLHAKGAVFKSEYSEEEQEAFYNKAQPDDDEEYPPYRPIADLVRMWPIYDLEPPAAHKPGLRVLSFRRDDDLKEAFVLREKELPFVFRHVNTIERAVKKFADDDWINEMMGREQVSVTISPTRHFMRWNQGLARSYNQYHRDDPYIPPTRYETMAWRSFRKLIDGPSGVNDTHYYLMYEGKWVPHEIGGLHHYLRKDDMGITVLYEGHRFTGKDHIKGPYMNKAEDPDWPGDDPAFKPKDPVLTRFGMKGVTAEAHYDSNRNILFMVRGRKRYIISPPEDCSDTYHLTQEGHPETRHSQMDYARAHDREYMRDHERFRFAQGVEVVLYPGDALYLPAFWIHYLVNLDTMAVQSNQRAYFHPEVREVSVDSELANRCREMSSSEKRSLRRTYIRNKEYKGMAQKYTFSETLQRVLAKNKRERPLEGWSGPNLDGARQEVDQAPLRTPTAQGPDVHVLERPRQYHQGRQGRIHGIPSNLGIPLPAAARNGYHFPQATRVAEADAQMAFSEMAEELGRQGHEAGVQAHGQTSRMQSWLGSLYVVGKLLFFALGVRLLMLLLNRRRDRQLSKMTKS